MLTVFAERLGTWLSFDALVVRHILESIAILVAVFALHMLSVRLINRHVDDVGRRYRWRRVINYTFGVLAALLVGRVWLDGLRELGVMLGLASAGIAIAMREPLVSIAGWIFIMVRRPFHTGDRISLGNATGDVIDIRIFQTVLMECGQWIDADQSTGRLLYIPNNVVFNTPLANYTAGFAYVWDELVIRLTFESDWRLAKRLVSTIAQEHGSKFMKDAHEQMKVAAQQHYIVFHKLTPIVYVSVRDYGVQLTLRYLAPVRGRRNTSHELWEAILTAFKDEPTIAFARSNLVHPAPPPAVPQSSSLTVTPSKERPVTT